MPMPKRFRPSVIALEGRALLSDIPLAPLPGSGQVESLAPPVTQESQVQSAFANALIGATSAATSK